MSPLTRAAGWWALMQPRASLLVVAIYGLCCVVAAGGHPMSARLAVAVVGMTCMQFSIGALNDYCDRASDAITRHKPKPIVLGVVSPRAALVVAMLLAAATVALYVPFGRLALAAVSASLLLGFAYDLGMKSTPASGIMIGLAFPMLPLLAWDLFATVRPALLWTFALGVIIGLAVHLADALPDAEADSAVGVYGLSQLLGRWALATCWGLLALADLLAVALAVARVVPVRALPLVVCEAIGLALVGGAIASWRRVAVPQDRRLRRNFGWSVASAMVIAAGWLVSAVV